MRFTITFILGLLLFASLSSSLSADEDWESCGDDSKTNSKIVDTAEALYIK